MIIVKKPTPEEKEEALTWPLWEKEVSEFDWSYDTKETCLVVAGRAIITYDVGEEAIEAGDYVVFDAGLKCVWKIIEKVEKHYKFG